jgi:CTP synthase (UTP-ammonia lyase)
MGEHVFSSFESIKGVQSGAEDAAASESGNNRRLQPLKHAAKALSVAVESQWLPTQSLADERPLETMKHFDALWCSPGSPYKSMNGALRGVRFAREMGVPFIGT